MTLVASADAAAQSAQTVHKESECTNTITMKIGYLRFHCIYTQLSTQQRVAFQSDFVFVLVHCMSVQLCLFYSLAHCVCDARYTENEYALPGERHTQKDKKNNKRIKSTSPGQLRMHRHRKIKKKLQIHTQKTCTWMIFLLYYFHCSIGMHFCLMMAYGKTSQAFAFEWNKLRNMRKMCAQHHQR